MSSRNRVIEARMLRAQRARQMAGQPTHGFFGDALGFIGKAVTSVIPGPIDDMIFEGARGLFSSNQKPGARASCPPGFRADPRTGVCKAEGVRGTIERILPGGQTGMLPTGPSIPAQVSPQYGNAVVGAFGRPALQPYQTSTVALRCPPGSFLGKDNLCYDKLPAAFRKWKPKKKPPISAKDWAALQTSKRVSDKAKRIASTAGFSCRKK